jgi:hypothetical protein
MSAIVDILKREQMPSGAFRSYVKIGGGRSSDENGFVTALVLRELALLPCPDEILERAIDFLLRCESRSQRGTFCFWPEDAYPQWMRQSRLYPDVDDTSVMAVLLADFRVWDGEKLERAVASLIPHRNAAGAFYTWLGAPARANTIDWCANTNAAALLARAGMTGSDEYAALCSGINRAVEQAGEEPDRISPYYPLPVEFLHAVEHATRHGAVELEPAAARLRGLAVCARYRTEPPPELAICSSIDRAVVWSAPVLQTVRRMRTAAEQASMAAVRG